VALAALLTFAAAYAWWRTRGASLPFEDAAILLRYSENLAGGHGIVWNLGEQPLDGATDFLFMVSVAAVMKLGLSVENAAKALELVAHLATVAVVYVSIRRVWRAPTWMALASGAYVATGPALAYVAAYFGTPFFTLWVALVWYAASRLLVDGPTHRRAAAFAALALVMGLTRPDGVFLAVFMLLGLLVATAMRSGSLRGAVRGSASVIGWFAGVYVLVGGAYFAWRWQYFDHPLPNPFYVKSERTLSSIFSSARTSVSNVLSLTAPFLLALVLGLRSRRTAWRAVFPLLPIVAYALIWALLNDLNYEARFQYATLPIALMSWPAAVQGLWSEWGFPRLPELRLGPRARATLAAVLVLVVISGLKGQVVRYGGTSLPRDGRADLARMLHDYAGRGYMLATTEAGLLPLYSGWRVIDTWGLNDAWIARHGAVTAEYLDRSAPEVIMVHAFFSPITRPQRERRPGSGGRNWDSMVQTLKHYAERRPYRLAAAFGREPADSHYYYVRRDFPDSEEITRRIRRLDYAWYLDGESSFDFAAIARGERVRGSHEPAG